MPLGPMLMRKLSIDPLQFGSLVSSYNISAAIAGVVYGLFADKFDRKKMLILNFIGFIVGTVFCGLAQNYESLLAARIIAGAFGGTLTSVVMAMVTDLIPFQRRGQAMGTVMSSFSIASVIGVPLGLLIAEKFDWHYTFYFIALFGLFSLILSTMVFPSLKDHIHPTNALDNLKRLFSLLVKKDYLKSYSLIFFNVFTIFTMIPYLSPYAVKNIGILETELKFMYLIGGLFTVITARIIGKLTDKKGSFNTMAGLVILSIFPIYLYTHAGVMPLYLFIAMSTFFMTVVSGRMIPLMTMLSEIADSKDRGTFMGLLNAVRGLGSALATLFAGIFIVENTSGTLEGFDTVGIISIFISLILIFGVHHVYKILLRIKSEASHTRS